jgi:exosome complex component RRP46
MSFTISPLSSPDGSSLLTLYGFTILSSVSGPIEVSRRDELPSESYLEVNIRPAVGTGCTHSPPSLPVC